MKGTDVVLEKLSGAMPPFFVFLSSCTTFLTCNLRRLKSYLYWCLFSIGGLKMKEQEAALRKEPDIIIATPGRLVDHLHNTPSFGLQNIEILVLDEADRFLLFSKSISLN